MQLKYPSALKYFEKIMSEAKKKKIAIFSDYDGTLSPIVDDPDRAIMSDGVRIFSSFVASFAASCFNKNYKLFCRCALL